MIPTDVRKIIRYLEDRADQLDEKSRVFVRDMAARLDKYGDTFYCSWKQRKYLGALYNRLSRTEPEKPESRLEELKERKTKLMRSVQRRRKREAEADSAAAGGIPLVMQSISANPVDAKMRHFKSQQQRGAETRKFLRKNRKSK